MSVPQPLRTGDLTRLGDYELTGRLGAGGMGTVYLGRAPDGRPVAVKVIRADLAWDDELRGRFRSEVNRVRQVPAFATAAVLDADPDHETPYLVVEYVDGPSLADVIRDRGPLGPEALQGLAAGVATALIAIHGAGVIHRDLKPGNVLFGRAGVKVIDFGIARPLEATSLHTRTDQMVGTVAYMAPERFDTDASRPVTPAADVFAWGIVITYAATGRTPFAAESAPATAMRILMHPPDLTGLHGHLRTLVARALAKDPRDRPTARELLDALRSGNPLPDPPRAAPPGATPPGSAPGPGPSPQPGSARPYAAPAWQQPPVPRQRTASVHPPAPHPGAPYPASPYAATPHPATPHPAYPVSPYAAHSHPATPHPAPRQHGPVPRQYGGTHPGRPGSPAGPGGAGSPDRTGRRVAAAMAALAVLVAAVVLWILAGPDSDAATLDPGVDQQLGGAAAPREATATATKPPAATSYGNATDAAVLELLSRLLPDREISNITSLDDGRLRLYLDAGDGPGMLTVSLIGKRGTARPDRGGAPRTKVESPEDNCVQDTVARATWGDGTGVMLEVASCLEWDGEENPESDPPLTPDEARKIAADPRWGPRMDADLIKAGARRYPDFA